MALTTGGGGSGLRGWPACDQGTTDPLCCKMFPWTCLPQPQPQPAPQPGMLQPNTEYEVTVTLPVAPPPAILGPFTSGLQQISTWTVTRAPTISGNQIHFRIRLREVGQSINDAASAIWLALQGIIRTFFGVLGWIGVISFATVGGGAAVVGAVKIAADTGKVLGQAAAGATGGGDQPSQGSSLTLVVLIAAAALILARR